MVKAVQDVKVEANTKPEVKVAPVQVKVKGRKVSGKVWKEEKKRFSSLIGVKPLKRSFEVQKKAREEKTRLKAMMKEIADKEQKEKEEKKERKIEQERRRAENVKKAEIVQT
eukprot:Ihof_evm19s25 gene=Ihof_evmTU19s25